MRPTIMSQGAAHVFGASANGFAVFLIALYGYVRFTSRSAEVSESSRPHQKHATAPQDFPLAYGTARSPFPVLDRLKRWRRRS